MLCLKVIIPETDRGLKTHKAEFAKRQSTCRIGNHYQFKTSEIGVAENVSTICPITEACESNVYPVAFLSPRGGTG